MYILIALVLVAAWALDRRALYRYLDNLEARVVLNYKDISEIRQSLLDINGELMHLNSKTEDLEMFTARLSQDIKAVAEDPNHIF